MLREIAGVISAVTNRRLVRHLRRRDEILLADHIWLQACFTRHAINKTFEQIGRFRAACAAISINRHGVRVNAAHAHMNVLGGVNACHHGRAKIRDVRPILRGISAEITDNVETHCQELAALIKRHFCTREVIAALRIANEMLAAISHPFHRALQPLCGFQHQRIFAIGKSLRAEATADIRRNHAELVGRNFHALRRDCIAHAMHALARNRQRELLGGGIILTNCATRFHVIGDQAIILDINRDNTICLGKNVIHLGWIAHLSIKREIVSGLFPNRIRTLGDRLAQISNCRARAIGHRDRFRRILRLIKRFSDDEGDGIANMLHRLAAEHRRMRNKALRTILVRQRRQARHRAEMFNVRRGENKLHTLHAARSGEITNVEIGMRMR